MIVSPLFHMLHNCLITRLLDDQLDPPAITATHVYQKSLPEHLPYSPYISPLVNLLLSPISPIIPSRHTPSHTLSWAENHTSVVTSDVGSRQLYEQLSVALDASNNISRLRKFETTLREKKHINRKFDIFLEIWPHTYHVKIFSSCSHRHFFFKLNFEQCERLCVCVMSVKCWELPLPCVSVSVCVPLKQA